MNEVHITACQVHLNREGSERLKGFASIVFNEVFAVRDLKIIQGNEGLFVAMPSRRGRDGVFHDLAHPIAAGLREHIESVVLMEYEKAKAGCVRPTTLQRVPLNERLNERVEEPAYEAV